MKIKHSLLILNLLIILIGSAVLTYLYVLDGSFAPVVDVQELRTTKDVYKKGEMLQIISTFCKSRTVDTQYQWKLIDHVVWSFPEQQLETKKGCFTDRVTDIQQIPSVIAPGEYYLEATVFYRINSLKSIEYKFTTNKFKII